MTKNIKAILLILISSMVLNFAIAQATSVKFGVVDMARLVEEYSGIKGVQGILQEEFSAKDEALRALALEVKQAQDLTMDIDLADGTRKEYERRLLNLDREYARLAAEFRQDYNLRRNEELYKMQKEITDTILEYAEQNQYDLILESGMIYASDKLQLTDSILDVLRQKLEK
ncbi:OmpH family outer membrane protein [Wohlfahrtiimonas populi]|uniref:OmpH family outer membrane protein n=1 Tax=Wohlfahrtiimonas populi TaxID=1940240 RepID=UPI00098D4259|nr:OmpH family outer membrane protein [Wohlfahrtiimonas populi]